MQHGSPGTVLAPQPLVKSVLHEALRELFARRPDVLPEQLAPLLLARIDLPIPRLVAIDSELTDPRMPQLLPDAVLACPDGKRPRLVIVVEVLADILIAALSAVVRKRMEELMRTGKYEFHSDFAKKYFAEGLEQGLEKGLEKGREEGREEGRSAGQGRALLTILRSRDIAVPRAAARRIAAERDPERLDAWIARALAARSITDVFADD